MNASKIAVAGLAAILLATGSSAMGGTVYSASDPVTFYEVWRSATDEFGTAACFANSAGQESRWLTDTTFVDDTAAPGQPYYYWVRAITAQTRTATFTEPGWATDQFSGVLKITGPIGGMHGTTLPVRIEAEITDDNWGVLMPSREWLVRYRIGEHDSLWPDTTLYESLDQYWSVNKGPSFNKTHTFTHTGYYDIPGAETTLGGETLSPAELYTAVAISAV